MKGSSFLLSSLAALAAVGAVAACDPPREAAAPARNLPPVVPVELPTFGVASPSVHDPGDAGAATPHRPVGWFPPPKPTAIPLARTGNPELDAKLAEGDAAFAKEEFPAALKLYGEAQRLSPKHPAPLVGVARSIVARETPTLNFAAAKGNRLVQNALADLRRALKLDPEFGPAEAELGRALLLLGDAPLAIDPLRRAAGKLPNEPEVHSALGVALLASGRGEEAVGSLARAVELDPGSAPRRGNLGTVLFMRGRIDEAVKEYEAQVALDAADPRAHSDLGTALLSRNDFVGAMRELERAVELDPKRATFRSNIGYALQLQGKHTEAIASYREAIRLYDKLASAWINLATVLAKDPATRAEARTALEKARALDPQDPRVVANFKELEALEKESRKP
mgnify:CR=1 FL=1